MKTKLFFRDLTEAGCRSPREGTTTWSKAKNDHAMQSFNVERQGPFPVTIEDFSSRNGLLPVSNVHPLSVTNLLQQEDYCCYKREGRLKMRTQRRTIK